MLMTDGSVDDRNLLVLTQMVAADEPKGLLWSF